MWGETKVPHYNRGVLSSLLQMPEHRIHFVEPDVGGGFGVRGEFYPENFLVPFAAIKTGRPVKWTEDRAEHLISANHSREHVCELELAVKSDGTILGMRARVLGALGGYVRTHGASVPTSTTALLPGPYYIPNYQWDVKCVLTNKVGMGTVQRAGPLRVLLLPGAAVRHRGRRPGHGRDGVPAEEPDHPGNDALRTGAHPA